MAPLSPPWSTTKACPSQLHSPLTSIPECPVCVLVYDFRSTDAPAPSSLPQFLRTGSLQALECLGSPPSRTRETQVPVTLTPFRGFLFPKRLERSLHWCQEGEMGKSPSQESLCFGGKNMLNSNKASVTPPAPGPRVTLLARKVSQGWGPHGCISVQWRELGQRWPEPLSGSTCSWPLLAFGLSTPAKWPGPGQTFLPLRLCSHWTLSLEGVSPAKSTGPGPLLAAVQEAPFIPLLEQFKNCSELMHSNCGAGEDC